MSNDQSKKLMVDVVARIDKLEKGMAKAAQTTDKNMGAVERRTGRTTRAIEKDMSKIEATMAKANASMSAFGKGLAAGLVGGGIVGALETIRKSLSDIAAIKADASTAGLNVTQFQELQYAANQASVSNDALVDGLKELSLRAEEFAVTGKGSAAEAFQRMGYTAEELKTKLADPVRLFEEIMQKMRGLSAASQIRLADEIFGGTGGEQFVRFLDDSVGSIRTLREQAHAAGQVLDESMVQKAIEADRQFKDLEATATAAIRNIAVELAGPIKSELAALINMAKDFAYSFNQLKKGNIKEGLGIYWGPNADMDIAKRKLKAGIGGEAVPGGADFLNSIRQGAAPAKRALAPAAPEAAKGGGGGRDSAAAAAERLAKAYSDLEQRASERVKSLQVEHQAMGMTTAAAEALRMETELLNQAQRKGLQLSPEQTASLKEKARQYGELAESLERVGDMSSTAESIIGGFAKDLAAGTSAADAFKNALNGIANTLIDMAVKSLVKNALGGLLDGGFGSLFGGGGSSVSTVPGFLNRADGGWIRGPGTSRSDSIPAMLSNGEYVINAESARRYAPLIAAINKGTLPKFANGGPVGFAAPTIPRVAPRGGGGTNVIINNHTGQPVQQRQDANGNTHIDIGAAVDAALAERMGVGGRGATARLLQARMNRAHYRG